MYSVDLLILLRERRNRMLFNSNCAIDEVKTIDAMIQFIESEIMPSSIPCDLNEYSDRFILKYGQGNSVKSKTFYKKENTNMNKYKEELLKWTHTDTDMLGNPLGHVDYSQSSKYGFTALVSMCNNTYNRIFTPEKVIDKVIFNDPATIVFWADGTKTVVKCGKDDIYDPEKGLAMAISKKFFGNKGNYFNQFKKWLPEKKEEPKVGIALIPTDVETTFDHVRETMERLKKSINKMTSIMAKSTRDEIVDKTFEGATDEELSDLIERSKEILDIHKETK